MVRNCSSSHGFLISTYGKVAHFLYYEDGLDRIRIFNEITD